MTYAPRLTEALAEKQAKPELAESIKTELLGDWAVGRANVADVLAVVKTYQNERDWEAVIKIADAVSAHVDPATVTPELWRRYSQALIEVGGLTAAELVLRSLVVDSSDPDEQREANGLLGRIQKQRYIDFANEASLRGALTHYATALTAKNPDIPWMGANVLALVRRAEQDNVSLPPRIPRPSAVVEQTRAEIERKAAGGRSIWEQASLLEVELFEGNTDEAAALAESVANCSNATAFELGSLRRQLIEIWQLDPNDQILRSLAAGALAQSVALGIDVLLPEGDGYERILGKQQPTPLVRLDAAIALARSVCRIYDQGGVAVATGFLIRGADLNECLGQVVGDDFVLVTNAHVIDFSYPLSLDPSEAVAEFTRWPDPETGGSRWVGGLQLLWSSPPSEHDTSVLAIDNDALADFQAMPIAKKLPTPEAKDPHVFVLGHPLGRDLEISMRGNELSEVSDDRLQYQAPTEKGNSGSPVFDTRFQLVGLHHFGGESVPGLHNPSERNPANQAITIKAIDRAMTDDWGTGKGWIER